jgi:hypothetical protein
MIIFASIAILVKCINISISNNKKKPYFLQKLLFFFTISA